MFGYIALEKTKLNQNEIGLYQTFMCGICMSTKNFFGNYARAFISYDINFFNILFHSALNMPVSIDNARCVASPFKKRTLLHTDQLTDKLAKANVILNYLNLEDDVIDGGSLKKKLVLRKFNKEYQKAAKLYPEMDSCLTGLYEQLRQLELSDCKILDKICHPFAELSQKFAKIVLDESASVDILDLCYNVGKWIYLVDALDDLDKDYKKGCYNPLISCIGGFSDGKQFVKDNLDVINFELYTTLNRLCECYNDLNLTQYKCLLNNVIYDSMRNKTQELLNRYLGEKDDKQSV